MAALDTSGDFGRITTQNLVTSAEQAIVGNPSKWSHVEDLATLIDASVIHDQLFVLGRGDDWRSYGQQTDFVSFLQDDDVLSSTMPSQPEMDEIERIAAHHLALHLGIDRVGEYGDLVNRALNHDSTRYGLLYHPDYVEDLELGIAGLRSLPAGYDPVEILRAEAETARGTTFLVRTFLYLGYASVADKPLLPDHARGEFLEKVGAQHQDLVREKALESLTSADEASKVAESEPALDSPFASIVFHRCAGNRHRLADETKLLRDELSGTRDELRKFEAAANGTESEIQRAREGQARILAEVERNFGPYAGRRISPSLIDIATGASEVQKTPTSLVSWAAFFSALPFDVLRSWWRRRPLIEIHRLRDERPGRKQKKQDIANLFGDVRPGP